jgi:hypothetical protein
MSYADIATAGVHTTGWSSRVLFSLNDRVLRDQNLHRTRPSSQLRETS